MQEGWSMAGHQAFLERVPLRVLRRVAVRGLLQYIDLKNFNWALALTS